MKKRGMILAVAVLCTFLTGCSGIFRFVRDSVDPDNPLNGKNTDERILMCLEEEYPEHDFSVVESFDKEKGSGIFRDEQGIEFDVHNMVYNNTYHFGCDNDYLKTLLEEQDYESKVEEIAGEYGFTLQCSDDTIGIEGKGESGSDPTEEIVEMIQKILKCVEIPQIVYPEEAGSFSTGEVNYYSIPCWGNLTCIYMQGTRGVVMGFQMGEENSTEEAIRDIVEEELARLEKNISESKAERETGR